MKFCQVLNYPESHLAAIHATRPHLPDASFKELTRELALEAPDATALWMPSIEDAGHSVQLIVANDLVSQRCWLRERGGGFQPGNGRDWTREIVIKQLGKIKPDILCIGDPETFDTRFVDRLGTRPRQVIGWSTTLTTSQVDWSGFDLVLSPHPACVRQAWRRRARDARLLRPGFPRSVAEAVFQEPITLDVVFCGNWIPGGSRHNECIAALAKAALEKGRPFSLGLHLDVPDDADLPPEVRKLNQGPRYGLSRYRALSSARIVVTQEPDAALGATVAPGIFEGTGVGAFTLAAASEKLPEFFKPGSEIVVHQGPSDLIAQIHDYLGADDRRNVIARAGQERCLTEHSMEARIKDLFEMLSGRTGGMAAAARRFWHCVRA